MLSGALFIIPGSLTRSIRPAVVRNADKTIIANLCFSVDSECILPPYSKSVYYHYIVEFGSIQQQILKYAFAMSCVCWIKNNVLQISL